MCPDLTPPDGNQASSAHPSGLTSRLLLSLLKEVDAMTRILSAALVCTLVCAHLAGAQPSDPTEAGATRLLVGPTARTLEHGQFYVDFSAFVGGPFAQVGITD